MTGKQKLALAGAALLGLGIALYVRRRRIPEGAIFLGVNSRDCQCFESWQLPNGTFKSIAKPREHCADIAGSFENCGSGLVHEAVNAADTLVRDLMDVFGVAQVPAFEPLGPKTSEDIPVDFRTLL